MDDNIVKFNYILNFIQFSCIKYYSLFFFESFMNSILECIKKKKIFNDDIYIEKNIDNIKKIKRVTFDKNIIDKDIIDKKKSHRSNYYRNNYKSNIKYSVFTVVKMRDYNNLSDDDPIYF